MSSDFADIDFREYLESLMTSISNTYNIDPQRISIAVGAENIKLPIDTAIPCGLIVNELITNAVKHAFPEGRKGDILVRIAGVETGKCILEVKDNGVGIRKGLDIENASTLGLQLVNILVSQINGSLEIDCEAGTTFRIEFSKA
jgi:two-component sensor histidine kinase